jgi:AraC-like DNA-binding protein
MQLARPPGPMLRPFVTMLWASDSSPTPGVTRERMLPTGSMHLVFLLDDAPLLLFDDLDDERGHVVGRAMVGGARSSFYVRDVSKRTPSVGAMIRPGAAALLLGVPAEALAERHTSLADLWGPTSEETRERLAECSTLERRLEVLESILAARLPRVRAMHPAVAEALARFAENDADVGAVVASTGYSHRRFIQLFREAVGLAPKTFCRLTRFQRALDRAVCGDGSWAEIAADAGYSDQSHLHKDFVAFAGIAPGRYRELGPTSANHVPIR